MSSGKGIIKVIITGIRLTTIGYFLYLSITRLIKDTHEYTPYYLSPSPSQCNSGSYDNSKPPSYALLDKSYTDRGRPDLQFIKSKYNTQEQVCALYVANTASEMSMTDQRKLQQKVDIAAYSIFAFLVLSILCCDLCRCQRELNLLCGCPRDEDHNQKVRYIILFMLDCAIAPLSLFFIGTFKQECFQIVITEKFSNFSHRVTQLQIVLLWIFASTQITIFLSMCKCFTIQLKFCRRLYILIVFACIVVDVMCIVVVALQQPVWFIVLTMFKLALEFCWLKCWCCSGVQIEAGEEFADASGDVLQVTGVIISS